MKKRQRKKLRNRRLSKIPKKIRNKIRREAKRKTSGSVIPTGRTWDDDNSDPFKDLMDAYLATPASERKFYQPNRKKE